MDFAACHQLWQPSFPMYTCMSAAVAASAVCNAAIATLQRAALQHVVPTCNLQQCNEQQCNGSVQLAVPSASIARGGDARIAEAAKARHSSPAHPCACHACQRCKKPCQSPAGCAPETGSVAGYRMRPASGESCGVSLLLLLGVCELAAVGSGIPSREGGASSGLRRAASSLWSLLAVRSHSSARASLAANESAH